VQVVLDDSRADEQAAADLGVREAVAGEPGVSRPSPRPPLRSWLGRGDARRLLAGPRYRARNTAKKLPQADDRLTFDEDDGGMLCLNPSALDHTLIAVYFLVVLGIGAVARLSIKTDIDFLSGLFRRAPAT
jgi:hypothetical protein